MTQPSLRWTNWSHRISRRLCIPIWSRWIRKFELLLGSEGLLISGPVLWSFGPFST